MTLKELNKRLKDMEVLYGNAIVNVKANCIEYRIVSVNGYSGEKRPNECQDPNEVVINVKED